MGCDIHLVLEKQDENGNWSLLKGPERECDWCKEDKTKKECWLCKGTRKVTGPYSERNYNMFGILADVRNGRGFAGVKTGEGFSVIAMPRGLPKDMGADTKAYARIDFVDDNGVGHELPDKSSDDDESLDEEEKTTWLGDHSFSHLLLSEVLDFDWTLESQEQGSVDANEYRNWVQAGRKGAPESWWGGSSGPKVVYVTNDEMDKLFLDEKIQFNTEMRGFHDGTNKDDGTTPMTIIKWGRSYKECIGGYYDWFQQLKELGDPTKLRLVFGFDS